MDSDLTMVFDLDPAAKLQLVEDLWDDLARKPEAVPVHDWQIDEVIQRRSRLDNDPTSGLTWTEVEQRVRDRHGV